MKRNLTYPVLLVLVVGCTKSFSEQLSVAGLDAPGFEGFTISETIEPKGLRKMRTLVAAACSETCPEPCRSESCAQHARVSMLRLDSAKAETYVEEQAVMLRSTFEPKLPPYPEFLTKETGCPERFRPREKTGGIGAYYLLYAGERMGYGVCNDDLVRYRSGVGYFYCGPSGTVFTVQMFVPPDAGDKTIENVFSSLSCR